MSNIKSNSQANQDDAEQRFANDKARIQAGYAYLFEYNNTIPARTVLSRIRQLVLHMDENRRHDADMTDWIAERGGTVGGGLIGFNDPNSAFEFRMKWM